MIVDQSGGGGRSGQLIVASLTTRGAPRAPSPQDCPPRDNLLLVCGRKSQAHDPPNTHSVPRPPATDLATLVPPPSSPPPTATPSVAAVPPRSEPDSPQVWSYKGRGLSFFQMLGGGAFICKLLGWGAGEGIQGEGGHSACWGVARGRMVADSKGKIKVPFFA